MTSGPIIPACHAERWDELLAACERSGNDGADVYEAEEFAAWIHQRYGEQIETLIERLKTYIMRKMGDAWDPERFCPYTGLALWQFPIRSHPLPDIWPEPWAMAYWRGDGVLMRVRRPTAQEWAWLEAYPAEYAKQSVAFHAWLDGVRKKD